MAEGLVSKHPDMPTQLGVSYTLAAAGYTGSYTCLLGTLAAADVAPPWLVQSFVRGIFPAGKQHDQ